jgi:hypothetical protein
MLCVVELTEHYRGIYEEASIGGAIPDRRATTICLCVKRVGSWVADLDGRVVGLTGLFDRGSNGEVEPVVVTKALGDC